VAISADQLLAAYKASTNDPISNYYPSMAQDMLMHERQTEITTLNGVMSRYGRELGIPTPGNDFIFHTISCIQKHYAELYPKVK
jgi:ketopantoate reductase